MAFCSRLMFFIFSFFHFPCEFKIYGRTCYAKFISSKSIIIRNSHLQSKDLQLPSNYTIWKTKIMHFTSPLKKKWILTIEFWLSRRYANQLIIKEMIKTRNAWACVCKGWLDVHVCGHVRVRTRVCMCVCVCAFV